MNYKIIGKNMEVWEDTKASIEKKMDRIEKLFPEDSTATITLSREKITSKVEVTIKLQKRVIRAEVSDSDTIVAMDKVIDILERQIIRYKKRMRTKVRNNAVEFQAEYNSILVPEDNLEEDDNKYHIERVKNFDVKPMDAEEAVLEMELIGHNFFVFRNADSDQINIVYKRKDGSYGLIDPEF